MEIRRRELLTFSMLVALSRCESQVKGHIMDVRNGRAHLTNALTELLPFIGYPRTLNTLRVIDKVAPQAAGRDCLSSRVERRAEVP